MGRRTSLSVMLATAPMATASIGVAGAGPLDVVPVVVQRASAVSLDVTYEEWGRYTIEDGASYWRTNVRIG